MPLMVSIMQTVLKGVNVSYSFQDWEAATKKFEDQNGTNPPAEVERGAPAEEAPCTKMLYWRTMADLQLLCEPRRLQPPLSLHPWVLTCRPIRLRRFVWLWVAQIRFP